VEIVLLETFPGAENRERSRVRLVVDLVDVERRERRGRRGVFEAILGDDPFGLSRERVVTIFELYEGVRRYASEESGPDDCRLKSRGVIVERSEL
jgi:hypothetical protein